MIGRKMGMTADLRGGRQSRPGDGDPGGAVHGGGHPHAGPRTATTPSSSASSAKRKNVTKPQAGLFKKANVAPVRVLREVRLEKTEKVQGYTVGQAVTVEMFAPGELVDVVGRDQGPRLPGRRQAAQLAGRRGDPRLDVPPRPRLHRRVLGPVAGVAGASSARADGRGAAHGAEPERGARHARAEPAPRARGGAGADGRAPPRAQERQAEPGAAEGRGEESRLCRPST